LCQQEELFLKGGIIVSEGEQEIIDKFKLVLLTDEDKTQNSSVVPNSLFNELNMGLGFSNEKFGD